MVGANSGPFELSHVLAAELAALKGWQPPPDFVGPRYEPYERAMVYQAAHQLNLSALCLSGGGIRSAAFSLGVIQGLADARLLNKFDYLSTVSGGGYIGSWLTSWLRHSGAAEVLDALRSRRIHPDREPPAIQHLRDYSSFLTPQVGLTSADTWAAVAILFRNMLLNWLLLVPAIFLPVILVKLSPRRLMRRRFETFVHRQHSRGAPLRGDGFYSLGYKLHRLYFVRDIQPAAREQKLFLRLSVVPAVIAGGLCGLARQCGRGRPGAGVARARPAFPTGWEWAPLAIAGAMIYAITALAIRVVAAVNPPVSQPRPQDREPIGNIVKDVLAWTVAGVVCGVLVWLGAYLYRQTGSHPVLGIFCAEWVEGCKRLKYNYPVFLSREVFLVVFGMPWLLVAMRLGQVFYIMLRSYSPAGDFEREWLGRAGGWHLIAALAWIVLSSVVFLGTGLFEFWLHPNWLALIGAGAAMAICFLGKSSVTPGKRGEMDWKALASNIGLAIAGPLFAAILLIFLSMAFDKIVVGDAFSKSAMFADADGKSYGWEWAATGILIAVLTIVMLVSDYFINVNRFSLHALYRNRLIRAFLGAGRGSRRRPDGFTGFDDNDNFAIGKLWPGKPNCGHGWHPFQIINIALNLASSSRLAWQQRKAMSFAVSPLFCGAADLGYRNSEEYGNPGRGISLGTAMAISGAAVSPNMGYHSSPSIAFLLTLFNVRLGWWLGNPGRAGEELPNWERRLMRAIGAARPATAAGALCPGRPVAGSAAAVCRIVRPDQRGQSIRVSVGRWAFRESWDL